MALIGSAGAPYQFWEEIRKGMRFIVPNNIMRERGDKGLPPGWPALAGVALACGFVAGTALVLSILGGITSIPAALSGIILISTLTGRRGVFFGLVAAAMAAGVFFLGSGDLFSVLYWGARVAATGVAYGYLLAAGVAVGTVIAWGVGMGFLGVVLALPQVARLWASMRQQVMATLEPTWQFYQESGLLAALREQGGNVDNLRRTLEMSVNFVANVVPALTLLEVALTAVLACFLTRWVLLRLRVDVSPLPPFTAWRVPWYLAWGVIAGLALMLAGDFYGANWSFIWGQNIILLYLPLLLVIGTAVAACFYLYLPVPLFLKNIILLVTLFNLPFLVLILVILGAFDPLVDFRGRLVKEGKE